MNVKPLISTAGLIAIAVVLLLLVAVISMLPSLRIDLTEDRLYSLSDGTRNIVTSLEKPIELLFFYSESATEDIPQIRSYGTRVQELLREIVIASNGRLTMRIVDPEPFSEEEDLATQFGITPVPVTQGGERVYFGLVVSEVEGAAIVPGLPVSETLPLIRPDQEVFLEYEFMKLVTKVGNPDRQIIGLLTELDIDGGFNPTTGQPSGSWLIMDTIRQLYEVRRIDATANVIDPDIDILLIVHPQEWSEQMIYAIDQHILRGGKAMLFLDPSADSMVSRSPQGTMIPAGMSSDLPTLLENWGIAYDSGKVLTDSDFALRVTMGQGQRPIAHLGMLGIQRAGLTQDDIVTSRLETINLSSTGAISSAEGASTRFEPLIQSSANAMMMDAGILENVTDPSILFDEFESANQRFTIAARVSGLIESAFPNGAPPIPVEEEEVDVDAAIEDDTDAADDDVAATEPEEEVEEAPVVEHLARSNGEVNILVFADTDLLGDRLWVQVAQFLGQRIPQPFANNGDVVVNALDNLSGGADLVSIRSRGRYSRPFTRVIGLQREADDRLREQESELLDSLAETESQIATLNQGPDGQALGQITPEAQIEIDNFNQELLETRRRLRDVQFQLNEDIEQLGTTLKAVNTWLVPVLLSILILVAGYMRSRRRI
ncbi:MAG: GldG family protein [Gammaproteobacteria bacterium]|jgi:ABC-type uncharacterized transport system involved in gliding motility auxiliary subunit|nr:GldG family protein [Gammaproteobacteria bacterium]HJO12736.1 GldG family protein [Gammaproteobacteria bacterium]|tara:strand:+ start:10037 stop:12016 length:1980 start_codon:yes stop_codon:yes gene_type:complete